MRNQPLPNVGSIKTPLFLLTFLALFYHSADAQTCPAITTFPYVQSFDSVALPACWSATADTGYVYLWSTTTADASHGASGPKVGTRFAHLNVYNADIPYNPYTLTTQSFTLPATPQQLSYYYYLGADGYQGTDTAGGTDPFPLAIQISTNGGTTWTDIYDHSASNSTFATSNALSFWASNAISLAAYAGQTVQFRFYSQSNYGNGFTNQGLDPVHDQHAAYLLPSYRIDAVCYHD